MSEEIQLHLADSLHVSVSNEDLIRQVTDTENNFIERKTVSETRGWLKTAVAFANSCPIGYPGVLFVGVNNDGTVEHHKVQPDFEKLQKSISERIADAWPPIYHRSVTLRKDGAEFIAVLVPGSEERPHFSGQAYVRVGPQSKPASEEEYDKLIAQRSSKVRALQKLIGQVIYWHAISYQIGNANGVLEECNQFFVTIDGGTYKRCFPIDWITISFDPANKRYQLIVDRA